jgi:ascorbate-specific phosphotransferase enzyme iia component
MKLLKPENVQICEGADDWREAIKISVLPLEKGGYVKQCYKDGIIENLEKLGPYILIADDIALPHARPEQGAIESQVSITLFKNNIRFDREKSSARLFITLAAKDNESHLEALMKVSELLSDEEAVRKVLEVDDATTLYEYFEGV